MNFLHIGRMENPCQPSWINPSLITFKRDIRRIICKKGKQPKYPIHKITIIECPTCEKMVKESENHYCLPAREMDPIIFVDKPW